MSTLRTKKPRPREAGPHRDGAAYTARKKDKVPLHDEADLVNFRADSLTRLITNQDYMENATLKPFHTSHIAPPAVFPTHTKKAYEEKATDEEIEALVKSLKPEELWSGDIRLMRAKTKLMDEEWADIQKTEEPNVETEFSEKMRAQREAVERLAKLQSSGEGLGAMGNVEESFNAILEEYEKKFGAKCKLQQSGFNLHSIPIKELVPAAVVEQAPPLYNPRLINLYLGMKEESEAEKEDLATQEKTEPSRPSNMGRSNSGFNDNGFEEFGFLLGGSEDRIDSRPESTWNGDQMSGPRNESDEFLKNDSASYNQDYNKSAQSGYESEAALNTSAQENSGASKPPQNMDADPMVDLNQFLTDGGDDEEMDEMDALMDFDQGNTNAANEAEEEPFGVDFLNDMEMDLN